MSYTIGLLTPMLETKDLKATVAFYGGVLGFSVDHFNEEWGWAALRKDNVQLMFSLPNEHRNLPAPIMSGSLYFRKPDVDAVWNKIQDQCTVYYPIQDFEYGMREFAIYDNNGYLLQFGAEISE